MFSPRTAEIAILPPAKQTRTGREGTSKTHAKHLVPLISDYCFTVGIRWLSYEDEKQFGNPW